LLNEQGFCFKTTCYFGIMLDNWTTGQLDNWTTGQLDNWTTGQLDNWTTGQLDKTERENND